MPKKNKSGKKKSGTAQPTAEAPVETKQVEEPEPEPQEEVVEETAPADEASKKKKRKRKKKKAADDVEVAAESEEHELTAKEKLDRRKMILQAKRGTKLTPGQIAAVRQAATDPEEDGEETAEQKREKARALQTVIEVAPQKAKAKEEEPSYSYTELPGMGEAKAPAEEPAATGKGKKKKRDAKVPNVKPKLGADEEKRLNAMFGTLQGQDTVFIMKQDGGTEDVTLRAGESGTDLKSTPTLVIKDCKNMTITVNRRVVKALIQNCQNCTITFNQSILTNTLECWRCENITLSTAKAMKTLQLDMIQGVQVVFDRLEDFGAIVWNSVEGLKLSFKDTPSQDMKTGFAEAKEEMPDSSEVDQFIIRNLSNKMTQERCVRLKNGFLSTEREAIDWDKKNTLAFERYKATFLKEAGVSINKDPNEVVQKPNAPCACGSGKKYKKCCMGKKVVMGVAGDSVSYKE